MNEKEATAAIIYTRVSSRKQEKEGHGHESQDSRCREFAAFRKREVLASFNETISGARHGRPQMKAMLDYIRDYRRVHKKRIAVIIDDISRLARDIEVHRKLRRTIKAAGGDLESPSLVFGESSDSRFFENMQALNSEYMRQKNGEQVVNRMRARCLAGYYVFQPPIGYKYIKEGGNKKIAPHEPIASILREALEGFASGRLSTQSDVMRFLQSQPGFPKNRHGLVHPYRVTEILNRVVYTGYFEVPQWNVPLRKGVHDALISFATFQKIQKRLKTPGPSYVRKDFNEDFPLRGFVCCADCNKSLRAAWTQGRSALYGYYVCQTKDCRSRGKSIKREVIEGQFEALLRRMRPSKDLFDAIYVLMKAWWDHYLDRSKDGIAILKTEMVQLERQADKLIDLIVDAVSPDLRSRYEVRLRQIDLDKVKLNEKMIAYGQPKQTFDAAYRTAMLFLSNPLKLWVSEVGEGKISVLKLAFSEKLIFARDEGYRTAKTSMPFSLLEALPGNISGLVELSGVEPLTSCMPCKRSTS